MSTWPAPLRHLILLTAALLTSWGATDAVPALQGPDRLGRPPGRSAGGVPGRRDTARAVLRRRRAETLTA